MSRPTLPVVAALLILGAAHSTAYAQAPQADPPSGPAAAYSDVQNFPVNSFAFNSCQAEMIHLTGTEHVVRTTVRDGASTKSVYHLSYSDTKAVGVKTGLTYIVAAQEQQVTFAETGVSSSYDFVLNERLNGQGGTPDLGWHLVQTAAWDGSKYTITTKSSELTCR
jgi:hypothetical protein